MPIFVLPLLLAGLFISMPLLAQRLMPEEMPADSELITLSVDAQQQPAWLQPANRAEPHGAVLILADRRSDEHWSQQTLALRLDLAEQGWTTLALRSPRWQGLDPDPLDQLVVEALRELQRREHERFVVIAVGNSSAGAARALQTLQDQLNVHLVMIQPEPEQMQHWQALLEAVNTLEGVVIDLYRPLRPGTREMPPDVRMRRNAALRAEQTRYLQLPLKGEYRFWINEMPWLTRQVRGLIEQQILLPELAAEEAEEEELPVDQLPPGVRR